MPDRSTSIPPDGSDLDLLADRGFILTRWFVWILLGAFTLLGGAATILSWYFQMDVSVKGDGVMSPAARHRVKPTVTGIVREVHVKSGAAVRTGDRLVSLDDREWKSQLQTVDEEIAIVSNRIARLQSRLHSERRTSGCRRSGRGVRHRGAGRGPAA